MWNMLSGVRMRFIVVVVVTLCVLAPSEARSRKKAVKDESAVLNKKLIGKSKPPTPPAIIAIEIVDPNENKTSSKNAKRTIDSSLGYGYQSYYTSSHPSPPRYEVYKYSQHDIPAYHRPAPSPFTLHSSGGGGHTQYDIQKSIEYKIPQPPPSLVQYYQPGTTLYSTVNNHGQVGGLSTHIPQQQQENHYGNEPQVPVIILRVLPSQLADPSAVLHPNLPQSHPLASTINSIDIQALLSKYVQNLLTSDQHQHHQPEYQQPEYQQPEYHQPDTYQQSHHQDDGLLTHENYPKDTHTRVIFHKEQPAQQHETKTIKIQVPDGAFSGVEVQEQPPQYYQEQNQGPYYYDSQQDGGGMQGYYFAHQEPTYQMYHMQQYDTSSYGGYEQSNQVAQPPPVEQPPQQEHATPYNYHAHQKRQRTQRSKKSSRRVPVIKDIRKLDPIKA